MDSGKVLVVDDDLDILTAARLLLKRQGLLVHTENNPDNIPGRMKDITYDVVLLDMNFTKETTTGQEGFDWLRRILQIDPSAVVVMITAFGDVNLAVDVMKEGAVDFILKPWQNEKFIATISSAIKLASSRTELNSLRSQHQLLTDELNQGYGNLIGKSTSMKRVYSIIDKVAVTDADVLILGENGTGKELVANALHMESNRKDKVFMSVDVGSLTETLFESELFGYVKGAFTDAKQDRAGRFEVASGGTLFLDEIGNCTLTQQAKLLRVLETREVVRVGSNQTIPIDIRLICATNMPLQEMVERGEFRQDLLYRINTVEIPLPPLHDRTDDIPLLAEHFLFLSIKKYRQSNITIPTQTMQALKRYNWPGNIRELQHAIERAVIMSEGNKLLPTDFYFGSQEKNEGKLNFEGLNLDNIERTVIIKALTMHSGNIQAASKELGLTRPSLYRRMEKYGL